ncbi:MAG: HD domain-containing protein [Candidatus Micrarchaeia archaeon]
MKQVKDALYNYIRLNDCENSVVNSPYFQRLRYVKQLAMAYLVYPGANHTRFEHSLGVLFLANRYFELLGSERDEEVVLAALLHDIGHGPFSHESEPLLMAHNLSHERLSVEIVSKTEIADILSDAGCSPRRVCNYINGMGKGTLITGALGIDRIDYLMRDSYYAGTVHGKIDYERLLSTISVKDGRLVIDSKGIEAAEALVVSRFLMFSTVYQHKTVSIASAMLRKAIDLAYEDGAFTIDEFSRMADYECIMRMRQSEKARSIIDAILNRRLYKPAILLRGYEISDKMRRLLDRPNFISKIEDEICSHCNISKEDVIVHYTHGSYKPVHVRISGRGESELSKVSDVVSSIRKASEGKRILFIAVPQKMRNEVSVACNKILGQYLKTKK